MSFSPVGVVWGWGWVLFFSLRHAEWTHPGSLNSAVDDGVCKGQGQQWRWRRRGHHSSGVFWSVFEMESCKANLLSVTYWVQWLKKSCLPKVFSSERQWSLGIPDSTMWLPGALHSSPLLKGINQVLPFQPTAHVNISLLKWTYCHYELELWDEGEEFVLTAAFTMRGWT